MKQIFYRLPVGSVRPGMWTGDGQEIIDVRAVTDDGTVLYDVYTPRPDDPEADEENACAPEGRIAEASSVISLMWCADTPVDGSGYPEATDVRKI